MFSSLKSKSNGSMTSVQRAYLPTTAPKEFKLVLFGFGGVGKSAITIQLIRQQFVEEYDPTIEDSYRKTIVVDGEEAELDILDTAGQEEYSSMRDQYIRNGHGFLVVYSIDCRDSFREANTLLKKITQVKDTPYIPLVLVANKCDLSTQRVVTVLEGQDLARCWNSAFIETSAKLGIHVIEGFEELVRSVRRVRYSQGVQPIPRSASTTNSTWPHPSSPTPLRGGKSRQGQPRQDDDEVDLLGCCTIL